MGLCSMQRSKPTRPPLGIQATWGVIYRGKTLPELFQSFGTLAERGRERKGRWTHQLLPSLVLHAPSNGQPTSQVQTDTTVVLHAPNSGLQLERERGLNNSCLPQSSSSYQRLQFFSIQKLHKKSSIAQNQVFSEVLRSTVYWLHKLAKWFLFRALFFSSLFSSRSKTLLIHHVHVHIWWRPESDGRPPDLHLVSLWICRQLSLQRISTWCMILRHAWLWLEPMSPAHWAKILATRPQSPWSYCLLLSYIDPFIWFLKLLCWNSFSYASGIRYLSFSSVLYAPSLVGQSKFTNVKVRLVGQSDFDDVTLGSPGIFCMIPTHCLSL